MSIRQKSIFLALFAALGIFLVALPHSGLLGFGRPLFVDEAVNIDSGISFLSRGWITYRGVPQAYSPLVSSGVLGSLLPASLTEASGTYVAGRSASAAQASLSLAAVGLLLALISQWPLLCLLFSGLVLLIPALPASLVYTQAEPLSFFALSAGFVLFATNRSLLAAAIFFWLAVHLKLLAIVDIAGSFSFLALYAYFERSILSRVIRLYAFTISVLLAGALVWQAVQIALTPTWSEYLSSWSSFAVFFKGGGSGLREEAAARLSRWDLITTNASEFGSYSVVSKALILGLCVFPIIGIAKVLRSDSQTRATGGLVLIVCFSGAAIFHLGWWLLKSEQIWIRHGFLGLFSACAVAALLLGRLVRLRKLLNVAGVILFVAVFGFKSWRGVQEFRNKPTSCLTQDIHFNTFCDPRGTPLKFVPWRP
ncbi:MAG: hypothetical protein EOP06_12690 [Proteobacteria bacterium]|nr:MAG: hypothetical protein EOP06_12690 [Pseudomonadota bacterium]